MSDFVVPPPAGEPQKSIDDPGSTAQASNRPTEAKVKASTVTAGSIAGLILVILSAVEGDQLIEGLPDWVPIVLGTAVTVLSTFAAGYRAPHTPRRDLPVNKR